MTEEGQAESIWSEHGQGTSRDVVFFFFQAEDGIRDLTVTGVQTCALPIFLRRRRRRGLFCRRRGPVLFHGSARKETFQQLIIHANQILANNLERRLEALEIGRASCRERV